MVSLRNEVRRKNRQKQETEKNDFAVRVSENSVRVSAAKVCENGGDNVVRVKEEVRVSAEVESEGFDGGEMKKTGVRMSERRVSVGEDEDNIPIGKILGRARKGDARKKKNPGGKNEKLKSENPSSSGDNSAKNGDIPSNDGKNALSDDVNVRDGVESSDNGVKVEVSDKEDDMSDKIINFITDRRKDVKVEQKLVESRFEEGDMVWAKVKSHPWWPGQVYNPIFASPTARRTRKPEHLLIAFFGDSSYGWFLESDLVPFEVNYAQKSKQSMARGFVKAVEEAMDEIGRRAALGLMCVCRNGECFRLKRQEGYVSVDVKGYVTPGLYSVGQIEAAKIGFRPGNMVSFVRRLAISPGSGEDRSIQGIKSVAEAITYRRERYVPVDEDYLETMRIAESTGCSGGDTWDYCERETEVICKDSTAVSSPVDEQKGSPRHVKDLAGRSILLEKIADNEDIYLLKRREGIEKGGSVGNDDGLMNYLIQADFLHTPESDSGLKEEQGEDTDYIGRYVFRKRVQNEDSMPIGRKEKKKKLCSGRVDFKNAQARRKEVLRKAFHRRPFDVQEDLDTMVLNRKTSETEVLNNACNSKTRIPKDFSLACGGIQGLNDLSSVNNLVGSHASQAEGGQILTEFSQEKSDMKTALIEYSVANNTTHGKILETKGKVTVSDNSHQEELQMGPTTVCAENNYFPGNKSLERRISSGKESWVPLKAQDVSSLDTSDELQKMQANRMDAENKSFLVNGIGQGSEVLVLKTTQNLDSSSLERISNGRASVDLPSCSNFCHTESVEIENKAGIVSTNADTSFHEDFPCLYDSTELDILKPVETDEQAHNEDDQMSTGLQNTSDKFCPKFEDMQLVTQTEGTFELPVQSADVAIDVNESVRNLTPSMELRSNLDHAVIKKTKGFKRLVKFQKSNKRIWNNASCLFDDAEPPKKQCKVFKALEGNSQTGIAAVETSSFDYARAALAEKQLCPDILPNLPEGNDTPCQDMRSENSRASLCELRDDLLSIALDPFYGIDRACPTKVLEAFSRFRSLVYKKSLPSTLPLEAAKTFSALDESEGGQDTKSKCAVKESEILIPLPNYKDKHAENVVENGSAISEPNEILCKTRSKMECSTFRLSKISRIQSAEAKEKRKRNLDVSSDGLKSMRRLRKLKDLNSIPSQRSELGSSAKKLSGIVRGDGHETVQPSKVLKKSYSDRPSNSSKTIENPMALCMKFPQGFALPSEVQLKAMFARFGPLDVSGTRIYCDTGSAQVVFKYSSDALTAYDHALGNSLFGQADVRFRIKQFAQPKKETSTSQSVVDLSKMSRMNNDEVPSSVSVTGEEDIAMLGSLDKHRIAEPLAEGMPNNSFQVQPLVQLKSCLKKADDSANDSGRETTRVTFLLNKEASLLPEITVEQHSQAENVNICDNTFLSFENKTVVNLPIDSNALEPDPPDISHQMVYLLMKCNDIVCDIGCSLGYVPYCPL